MSFKTLLFLAVLVGALVYFAQMQNEREAAIEMPYAGPLLENVRRDQVVEIRWEHVERKENVAMVKRAGDFGQEVWQIVDPIDYPAATDRVKLVMDGVFTRAREIPEADRALTLPHFDPPRAIIEVITVNESGVRQTHSVELGSLDADGMQVEARVNGRLVRILRDLDSALLHSITDLRSRQVFELPANRVLAIERKGSVRDSTGARDATFVARREGPHWIQHRPVRVQLDPNSMLVQARVLSVFYVEGFHSDLPEPSEEVLARCGLLQPDLTITLIGADQEKRTLLLSQNLEGVWYAKRESRPYIYTVGDHMMSQVTGDWDELRDNALLRAFRHDVETIEFIRAGRGVRLTQSPEREGPWTVAFRDEPNLPFGSEWPANLARVQEFLGALEQNPVALWLDRIQGYRGEPFPKEHVPTHLRMTYRGGLAGEYSAARFGAVVTTAEGTPLLAYQREQDQVAALVPLVLQDWTAAGPESWRSTLLWDLVEGRLQRLKLSQGQRTREYLRKIQGTWRYSDADVLPQELLPALDHLIYLKAERHLGREEALAAQLLDPVRVEFEDRKGRWHIAEIGPVAWETSDAAQGVPGENPQENPEEIHVRVGGAQSVARNQDLYRLLVKILGE